MLHTHLDAVKSGIHERAVLLVGDRAGAAEQVERVADLRLVLGGEVEEIGQRPTEEAVVGEPDEVDEGVFPLDRFELADDVGVLR